MKAALLWLCVIAGYVLVVGLQYWQAHADDDSDPLDCIEEEHCPAMDDLLLRLRQGAKPVVVV